MIVTEYCQLEFSSNTTKSLKLKAVMMLLTLLAIKGFVYTGLTYALRFMLINHLIEVKV